MTIFRHFSGNEGWSCHFAARIVNVAQLGGADFHEAYRVLERVQAGESDTLVSVKAARPDVIPAAHDPEMLTIQYRIMRRT